MPHPFSFFADSYETERLKTLSVWAEFRDDELGFRPAPLARTPLEHMVHQCVSEHGWLVRMLGIDVGKPELPATEDRISFLRHYEEVSRLRRVALDSKEPDWFGQATRFFDVPRTRAWVLTRRLVHSAHHRAQLTVYLRLLDRPLYSTYGPTADTGGLFQNQAPVIYRYDCAEALLAAEATGGEWPPLPGPGPWPPTERP